MTVSYCHILLVNLLFNVCHSMGMLPMREYAVQTENGIGFIDLVVSDGTKTLAIEVERCNRRIEADLAKAAALRADELLIVVPNPQVERLVKKRLRELACPETTGTFVACLPEAIKRLRHYFPLQL